ncbi:hypothetical protein ACQEVB_32165 [Pseudonocardia sp. CA-107938]|uniref:hypothetical protein n=1 Tax=Pseudonocardia sp. CA-107938 TaxID=3240021 RepID=UPI003D934EE9
MRDSGPALPDEIQPSDLDPAARRDLRGLQKETAELVARHLVAAGQALEDDPQLALQHARYARQRASRIAIVREAAGIAAYHAGEWAEALSDLRAARRMGGGPGHLAVMADIERALGRPERAVEIARGPEVKELDPAEAIELTIVLAGARRDLGELDAAVVTLQVPELDAKRRDPWSARLFYAYADNLLAAGRTGDAVEWFVHALDADEEHETDAADRVAELTGEPRQADEVDFLPDAEGLADLVADEPSPSDGAESAPEEAGDGDPGELSTDVTDSEEADGEGALPDGDVEPPDAEAPGTEVGETAVADTVEPDGEPSGSDEVDAEDGDTAGTAEPASSSEIDAPDAELPDSDAGGTTDSEEPKQ